MSQSFSSAFESAYFDNDVSMIGFAMTPWHAQGVIAVAEYLNSIGITGKKYAVVQSHSASGIGLDNEIFGNFDSVYQLESMTSFPEQIKAAVSRTYFYSSQANCANSNPPLNVACASFPGSYIRKIMGRRDRPVHYYLLDEGIGSYLSSSKDWTEQSAQDLGLSGVKLYLRRLLGLFDSQYFGSLKNKMEQQGRFTRFMLLNDDLHINPEVSKYYRAALDRTSEQYKDSDEAYENAVVINTQPLLEDGLVRGESYYQAIVACCELASELNYKIVIKPHPRETNNSRYKINGSYLDRSHGVAQESILASLNLMPKCIVGFNTSSLHTSSALFGVPGISFAELISEGDLTSKGIEAKARYKKAFSEIINFPSSYEELAFLLRSLN